MLISFYYICRASLECGYFSATDLARLLLLISDVSGSPRVARLTRLSFIQTYKVVAFAASHIIEESNIPPGGDLR